jgi:hypothetical protein
MAAATPHISTVKAYMSLRGYSIADDNLHATFRTHQIPSFPLLIDDPKSCMKIVVGCNNNIVSADVRRAGYRLDVLRQLVRVYFD